jgi:hypothetical protein
MSHIDYYLSSADSVHKRYLLKSQDIMIGITNSFQKMS